MVGAFFFFALEFFDQTLHGLLDERLDGDVAPPRLGLEGTVVLFGQIDANANAAHRVSSPGRP